MIRLLPLRLIGLQLLDDTLTLQIPNHDTTACCGTEPVSGRGETQGVNFVFGFERIEMFRVVEVPEHGCAVFSTGSTERAVGGDGDGVDVASVSIVVGAKFALGQFPDLSPLVSGLSCRKQKLREWRCHQIDNADYMILSLTWKSLK